MRAKRWNVVLGLCALSLACSDAGPSDPTAASPQPSFAVAENTPNQLRKVKLVSEVTSAIPGGTFTGQVRITRFSMNEAGQLVVSGVLDGVATIGGEATKVKHQSFETTATLTGGVAAPLSSNGITIQQVECQILFLDLGPLFLDVLGLQVDLSEIVLDITAVAGAGNLLGNLLCAVVNLLNGGLDLAFLSEVLDAILGVINAIIG